MNYIILDLEATCWDEKNQYQSEIIEIGAVKINEQQRIVGEYNSFIKPILHPQLSKFCTNLTSITQNQIETANGFLHVIEEFKKWIHLKDDYFLCSWGFYDKKQFSLDCKLHKSDTDWLHPHMSVKHQHATVKNLKKPLGLGSAIKFEGMTFEGTAHRGIDDARNIARIFLKYFSNWNFTNNS